MATKTTRSRVQAASAKMAPNVADLEEEVSRIYDLTSQSHDIEGNRFVFDGDTVPSVRRVCRQAVVDCGGKLGSKVDGSTDYLVVANEFGRDDEARRRAAELAEKGGKVRVITLREFAYMAPPNVGEQVRAALEGCQFVEEEELHPKTAPARVDTSSQRQAGRSFDPKEYEQEPPFLGYLSTRMRIAIGIALLMASFWFGLFTAAGLAVALESGDIMSGFLAIFFLAVTAALVFVGVRLIRSGSGK